MKTKPGVFEKNPKLKLKSNFITNTQNKEGEAFGWKILDRINDAIESMIKLKQHKTSQTTKKQL